MAENPDTAGKPPNPFAPAFIPTRPEETFGIPGLAEFDIVTFENSVVQTGIDGMLLSEFLRNFGSFTLVLEYDGIKVEQQFSREQIDKAVKAFETSMNPQRTTIPRVTRRPNATPPLQASLPLPLPAPANHTNELSK